MGSYSSRARSAHAGTHESYQTFKKRIRLFKATKGCIGILKVYMIAAGEIALEAGSDRLELCHFAEAYDDRKRPNEVFNPFRNEPSLS